MNPTRFDTSANISIGKHTFTKAFQSLLEESIVYEGPLIGRKFNESSADLNLSSARAALFSSVKNKTFDQGWRQEIVKKSMSFSQNNSQLSNNIFSHNRLRNLSNLKTADHCFPGIVSRKPSLPPHQESVSSAIFNSPKMLPPTKNYSKKKPRKFEDPLSKSKKHETLMRAKEFMESLKSSKKKENRDKKRNEFKEIRVEAKKSPRKQQALPSESDKRSPRKHQGLPSDGHKNKNSLVSTNDLHSKVISNYQGRNLRSSVPGAAKSATAKSPVVSHKRKRELRDSSPKPSLKKQKKENANKNPTKANSNTPQNDPLTSRVHKKPLTRSQTKRLEKERAMGKLIQKNPSPKKKGSRSKSAQRYLDAWIVYQEEGEFFIKGHVKDGRPSDYWRSTPIIKRISSYVLETLSGTICHVSGAPHEATMLSKGYSKYVIKQFEYGFPFGWKSILGMNSNMRKSTENLAKPKESNTRSSAVRNPVKKPKVSDQQPPPSTQKPSTSTGVQSKPLLKVSPSDDISCLSDDSELTEFDTTGTDMIKLLEVRSSNKATSNQQSNNPTRIAADSVNYFGKPTGFLQPKVSILKAYKTRQPAVSKSSQDPSNRGKQQASQPIDIDSSESSDNSSSDDEYSTNKRKKYSKRGSRRKSSTKTAVTEDELKKKANWTDKEVEKLKSAVAEYPQNDPKLWSKVAQKVHRTIAECQSKYNECKPVSGKSPKNKSPVKKPKVSDQRPPPSPQKPSTSAGVQSKPLLEPSPSDDISYLSDDSQLTEMGSTAADLINLMDAARRVSNNRTKSAEIINCFGEQTEFARSKVSRLKQDNTHQTAVSKSSQSRSHHGKQQRSHMSKPITEEPSETDSSECYSSSSSGEEYSETEKLKRKSSAKTHSKRPPKQSTQQSKKSSLKRGQVEERPGGTKNKNNERAPWTDKEVEKLKSAVANYPQNDPKLWSKVARKMQRTIADCKSKYNECKAVSGKSPKNIKAVSSVDTASHQNEDIFFSTEDKRKNPQDFPYVAMDNLEDLFDDLCAKTPRASSESSNPLSTGKFFITPVSERHTPVSSYSEMEVKINSDDATRCVKDFKRNQKKGAGRLKLINKQLNLQNMAGPRQTFNLATQLNKLNDIPTVKENSADDSEELLYFSDGDID
ncbi:mis18-binding protein 1-like isoform X1 [Argonauta hians]